jgi:hypothetical protein
MKESLSFRIIKTNKTPEENEKGGQEERKKELPQIRPVTGISQDYSSKFLSGLFTFYNEFDGVDGLKMLVSTSKEKDPFDIKKYTELFPPSEYENVINDKNRESVQRLDELSVKLKGILSKLKSLDDNNFEETAFIKTINEMYSLIYGDDINKIEENVEVGEEALV